MFYHVRESPGEILIDDTGSSLQPPPVPAGANPEIAGPQFLLDVPPPPRRLLVGTSGIGWGFLIYLVLGAIVLILMSTIARFLLPAGTPKLWRVAAGEIDLLIAVLAPAFILARMEGRRVGAYGLPRGGLSVRMFGVGALWGLIALTLLMLGMRLAGAFYFGSLALHGLRLLKFAAFWGVFFLVVGLAEEFLVRGYAQFTLSRGIGFWPTAVILSTAFGALHLGNSGEDIRGVFGAGLVGLFFCLTLRRTGDLWFAVGLHTSWDWGETFLYSVPNSGTVMPGHLLNSSFAGPHWLSGGSVGPEGSVLVFVVIAGMWVAFDRLYREVKYREEPGPVAQI